MSSAGTHVADDTLGGRPVARDAAESASELEASEAQMRSLFDLAPDAILVSDLEGHFTDINRAACLLLGYSREELLDKGMIDLVLPEEIPRLAEFRERLVHGERSALTEWELRRKDGTIVPVELNANILPDGRWQSFVRDISQRKATEAALRERRAALKRLYDSTSYMMGIDELQGDLRVPVQANAAATRLRAELAAASPERSASIERVWVEHYRRSQALDTPIRFEYEHPSPTGGRCLSVTVGFLGEGDTKHPQFHFVAEDITDRKRAVDALRRSEERFHRFLEMSSRLFWVAAPNGDIVEDPPTWRAFTGFTYEQLAGWKWVDSIHPDDREHLLSVWRDAVAKGVARYHVEYRQKHVSGEYRHVSADAVPIYDEDGSVKEWVGMSTDITEWKRAQEALRLNEERMRVSLKAAPVMVLNLDTELRITWIENAPGAAEECLGRTPEELLPTEEAARITRICARVLATGRGTREHIHVRSVPTGRRDYDLTVEPLRDGEGHVEGLTCAAWDVTDLKRAEDEQRFLAEVGSELLRGEPGHHDTLEEIAHLVVRDLADICVIDLVHEGIITRRVFCADPAQRPTCYAMERAIRQNPVARLTSRVVETQRPLVIENVMPADLESFTKSPDLMRAWRDLSPSSMVVVPLFGRGRPLGALGLVSTTPSHRYSPRDVAIAEQLGIRAALAVDNAQLYDAAERAIRARDDVLAIVAHDLRGPLSVIVLQSQLLKRMEQAGSTAQKPAEMIHRAAQRMNRLVQDMLDVARLELGSLQIERGRVSSRDVVREAVDAQRTAAAAASLELRLDVPDDLPDVLADRERIMQVFDNLLANAIKFTPPGGRIEVGAARKGEGVVFCVTDTGIGIVPEHLPHVFERFWQVEKADRRGSGLGLAIVKGIIEAHGGSIEAESRIGVGTTFSFTLPAYTEKSAV